MPYALRKRPTEEAKPAAAKAVVKPAAATKATRAAKTSAAAKTAKAPAKPAIKASKPASTKSKNAAVASKATVDKKKTAPKVSEKKSAVPKKVAKPAVVKKTVAKKPKATKKASTGKIVPEAAEVEEKPFVLVPEVRIESISPVMEEEEFEEAPMVPVNQHIRFDFEDEEEFKAEIPAEVIEDDFKLDGDCEETFETFDAKEQHPEIKFDVFTEEQTEYELMGAEEKTPAKCPITVSSAYNTLTSSKPVEPLPMPVVISNPFGFGMTSVIPGDASGSKNITAVLGANAPVNPSNTPIGSFGGFSSNFKSVSSPLDKLCNLSSAIAYQPSYTTTANALPTASTMNFSSSLPPTSPVTANHVKVFSTNMDVAGSRSKEAKSPQAIQTIILDEDDNKPEDFSI